MATTKVLSAAALQLQVGSTFEEDNMVTLPYTSYKFAQKRNMIEDESYSGVAFKDLPQKGVNDTSGSISSNLDMISFPTYIKAVTGYYDSGVARYDAATGNVSKLSLARKDGVSYKQYANVYYKSLKISGSPDGLFSVEHDLIGVDAEVRTALSGWPTVISAAEAMTFHEMSGSGYFRVGDQANALAAGDNLEINSIELEVVTGFDSEHFNDYKILTPEFGQVRPSVSASFRISKHSVDTFIGFRDNVTKLQLSMLIYKSATNSLLIEIPNFIIDAELTDDDLAKQDITLKIGRNGIGSSYVNSNMAFNAPIRFTVVNS